MIAFKTRRALDWFLAPSSRTASPRKRALIVLGLIVVVFAGLIGRLYSLQVMHHDHYLAVRDRNSTRTLALPGERGAILTSDGIALARTTFSGASLIVNPRAVPADQRTVVAGRLAALLGRDHDYAVKLELELIKRQDKYFYSIMRETPEASAGPLREAIKRGELPGVEIRAIETRDYPLGNFASHIVGFAGRDGVGQEGVERALDKWLRATPGKRIVAVDALARPLQGVGDDVTDPVAGATVELTINAAIQAIVEEELAECVKTWDPVSVSVVVLETHTGAVLGLSNYPNYDPNEPGLDASCRRNMAITDAFEPGSMFKPLIVCGAYQMGLLTPDSVIEYTPTLSVPGRKKQVSDGTHPIPRDCLELMDNGRWGARVDVALVKSSNTAMCRIGLLLGCERLQPFLQSVCFGQHTGFDLGGSAFGESRGYLRPLKQWTTGSSIPSVTMGYEVQVTPLQMANCFNAIATGGTVYRPYVIKKVTASDGTVLLDRAPEVLKATGLSAKVTREQMNETLKRVVSAEGTARGAKLEEYVIAGKTGTANKVKNGQYSDDKICSFVGYAPADNPQITVIVTVNEARAKVLNRYGWPIQHFGGTVAAPTMSQITLRTLKHLGVAESAPVVVKKD
ncbi:MAG: penicillin-binding protein 2 [Planctomycetes bacterium]|nr:penicillin-binding protein 2 [Planctomycetota bacterium]